MGREKERTPFGQRLFDARTFAKLTQPQLAAKVGMSQSTLVDAERIAQGSSYTAQLAAACGVRSEWLATGAGPMVDDFDTPSFSRATEPTPSYSLHPTMQPILAWEHEEDLPPGEFVMIPRLELRLSAGPGKEQVELQFTDKQPQAFRADWIRRKRLKPSKLASMVASGDSMEERIQDGDALVIDTSQTTVIDGKVYALWYDGGERVKRLYRLPGGGLRIVSDNPKHQPVEIGPESLEHVRVLGRVVHIAGEGGL